MRETEATDIVFYISKEVEETTEATEENTETKNSDLAEKLVDTQQPQTRQQWYSVSVNNCTVTTNEKANTKTITAGTITSKPVNDDEVGNLRGADDTDTLYSKTDDKRVPGCCCFQKTVSGLMPAEDSNEKTLARDCLDSNELTLAESTVVKSNPSTTAPIEKQTTLEL